VLKSHKIKAVVDMYGPVDLTTAYAREHSMVTRLMACSYKESPQMFAEASPLTWVSKDAPPTLILHGTRDMLVPVSQAGLLKQKLDSLGIPNVYRPLPGWPHTTDLVRRVNDYFKVTMRDFFEKHVLN
jgi:acetyl esterase/lipase